MSETPSNARPMTETERVLAQALAGCSFLPGSWDKRFVHDMAARSTVTEKQAWALLSVAWKYRRQLPPSIRPNHKPAPSGTRRPNELAGMVR